MKSIRRVLTPLWAGNPDGGNSIRTAQDSSKLAVHQLQGANAPALWLKQAGGAGENTQGIIPVVKGVAAVVAAAIVGTWMADQYTLPKPRVISCLLLMLIAYRLWKRS